MNDHLSVENLVAQLCAHLNVQTTDLPLLAKMHGWCEQIITAIAADAPPADRKLRDGAVIALKSLEQLILGETTSPAETLAGCILTLEALQSGGGTSTCPSPDSAASLGKKPESNTSRTAEPVCSRPEQPVAAVPPEHPGPAGEVVAESYASEPLRLSPGEVEFVQGFVVEANEHFAAAELTLLEVERNPRDADKINELFRPVHTIKGMAGFLNLRDIQSLAHEAETLLDQARKGARTLTQHSIDLIFQSVDLLKKQTAAVGAWVEKPNESVIPMPPVADMIQQLRDLITGVTKEGVATPGVLANVPTQSTASAAESVGETKTSSVSDQYVRIDTAKLDGLVDMVGELVIAQTQVSASTLSSNQEQIQRTVAQTSKIVRDLQEVAMSLRMTPIGPTFQRMGRLVRDVSRKLNKQVELVLSGEETELDKTVVQAIGDPLVHMVRNSIDHGIEPPEARKAAGKPVQGRVELSACHRDGNVQVVIRDDGRGLDREKLIAKATEKGLIQAGQTLTDSEAFGLIFAPGFSTATVVTDVSGRGVGMDVVRKNVERLRGKIEIESQLGKGTTFTIRLPLTLAIIDGMVVRVGRERFIIPTISIRQALNLPAENVSTVQQRGRMCDFRGRLVPLVSLSGLYHLSNGSEQSECMTVIAEYDNKQIGLVVDELIGQQQVVIKSLDTRFHAVRGVSGAAILGDGRVGLILDVGGVAAAFNEWHSSPLRQNDAHTADLVTA